jgi:hypothetical protein
VKAERSALEQALVELRASGETWGDAAQFLNWRARYIELSRDWDWLAGLLRMSDGDAVIAYMTAEKPSPEQWAKSFLESLGK